MNIMRAALPRCRSPLLAAAVCVVCFPFPVAAGADKLPVPVRLEQDKAEEEVKERFGRPPRGRAALGRFAEYVRVAAAKSKERPAVRFVLWRECRDAAADAGELDLALKAVRALDESFRIDALAMEVGMLERVIQKRPASIPAVVRGALEIMDEASTAGDFESARKLIQLSKRLSRAAKSAWLRHNLEDRSARLDAILAWQERVDAASRRVAVDRDDAAANLVLGSFRLLLDDRDEALDLLARCSDVELRKLAAAEAAQVAEAAPLLDLASRWAELAGRQTDAGLARAMERRAVFHCERALARDGSLEARVEEILMTLPEVHLSSLQEVSLVVGYGGFGKKGALGYLDNGYDRIVVEDVPSPRGLSVHPPNNGASLVSYPLARRFRTFRACIALNDSARRTPPVALTFVVKGDGKVLWTSRPVRDKRQSRSCEVNVRGVATLELQVECPGRNGYAQAVWLEPRVSR